MSETRAENFAAKRLIGRRLTAALKARGIKQIALSATIKRPQGVISEWLKGIRRVGFTDLWQLADALQLDLGELLARPAAGTQELVEFEADVAFHQRMKKERGALPPD